MKTNDSLESRIAAHSQADKQTGTDIVKLFSAQKIHFDGLLVAVIQNLLQERQKAGEKHHGEIMGEIAELSSDISCCEALPYSQNAQDRRERLLRQKADLQKLLRAEAVSAWQDSEELCRTLVDAAKRYEATRLRNELIEADHGNRKEGDRKNPEFLPGP